MAYANDIQNTAAKPGLNDRLTAALNALAKYRAQRRIYKATLNELSALSDRELADLGLARSEIRRIARSAANDH